LLWKKLIIIKINRNAILRIYLLVAYIITPFIVGMGINDWLLLLIIVADNLYSKKTKK
jgi:hypothetical protein